MHAKLRGVVFIHFNDQAFDHHLGAALVEHVDHFAQVAVQRVRRGDQQGVGGGVGLDGHAAGAERGVLVLGRAAGSFRVLAIARLHTTAGGRAAAVLRVAGWGGVLAVAAHGTELAARLVAAPGVTLAGQQAAQRLGQLARLGVAQVHHVHVAGVALGVVELVDQVARQLRAFGAAGANDDRVGTRIADHVDLLGLVGALGVQQFGDHGGDVHRDAVLDLHHVGVDGAGGVDATDDLCDPRQVFRIVGDDDAVVAGVGIDRVVRRHNGAQHRDQVHRVFVLQAESAGLHATAASAVDRPAEQLGISLRHHLGHAADIDHAEPLHAQRRQQHVVGLMRRHLAFADQRQVAFDTRVHQELLAGGTGQCAHHRLNVGVDKVELHRLVAQRVTRLDRRRGLAPDVVGHSVLHGGLGDKFALAIQHAIAAAARVGQRLAEFAVHQQRLGCLLAAACTERQQQQWRGHTKRGD
ncbi:hypothetical protein ALP39_200027 [Pseudomonas marginalis pv. marginalis]|nr:hypothetical protein ALP39_200027 [Pseudomonas marginalis pv. marginalis]